LLKGLILAESLYPDPAMRSFGDIDLVIHPVDYSKADYALSFFRRRSDESGLTHLIANPDAEKDMQFGIDLHSCNASEYSRQLRRYFRIKLQQEMVGIYSESTVTESSLGWIRVVDETNSLQYLCSHYMKHLLNDSASLSGLCDIAFLIEKYNESLDWADIIKRAKSRDLNGNLLYPPLLLASGWLDAQIPDEVLKEIRTTANRAVRKRAEVELVNFGENTFDDRFSKSFPTYILWLSYSRRCLFAISSVFPSVYRLRDCGLLDSRQNLITAYIEWYRHLWSVHIKPVLRGAIHK